MKKEEFFDKSYLLIGDISVGINSENYDFREFIQKKYKDFIVENKEPKIKLSVKEVPIKQLENEKLKDTEEVDVKFNKEKNTLYVKYKNFIGQFNIRNMEGELRCSHYVYFKLFLRIVYALVLLKEGGILIHAAGIINNGNGYIFPGESGAGKTTISKLSNDSTILTDELALIRKVDDKFIVYGTPFWGEHEISNNEKTEIKGIYFLKKDKKTYIEDIRPLKALQMLLPNIFFFGIDAEFTNKIFNICNEFIQKVPSYELHFELDPSFWRLI